MTAPSRTCCLGKELADKQWATTTPDGLTTEARFWVDDMYMITALQLQTFRATGDARYLDRAATAMAAYLDRLQQPNGLFFHTTTSPRHWGRGNGWFAAGMAELLRALPPTHSQYGRIMTGYLKMMAALLRMQTASGMWQQLVDDDSAQNWPETSSTGMFAFAMVTGVKNGWLPADPYGVAARKAWLALVQYLDADGNVRDVCVGTGEAATSGGGTSAATQMQLLSQSPAQRRRLPRPGARALDRVSLNASGALTMTQRRLIRISSRTLPLCALLLASCGGSTPGDGTGTAGTRIGHGWHQRRRRHDRHLPVQRAPPARRAPPAPPARPVIGPGAAGTTGSAGTAGLRRARQRGSAGTHRHRRHRRHRPVAAGGRGGTTGTAGTRRRRGARRDDGHRRERRRRPRAPAGTRGRVAWPPARRPTVTLPSGNDAVVGTKIQFNDNGGWCWYQDERAVVDKTRRTSSSSRRRRAAAPATAGRSRHLQSRDQHGKRFMLPSTLSTSNVDDHNSPALLIRPDGKYLAMWSGHRVDCISRTSIFNGTGLGRGEEDRLGAVRLPVGRRQHEHGHVFESLVHRHRASTPAFARSAPARPS